MAITKNTPNITPEVANTLKVQSKTSLGIQHMASKEQVNQALAIKNKILSKKPQTDDENHLGIFPATEEASLENSELPELNATSEINTYEIAQAVEGLSGAGTGGVGAGVTGVGLGGGAGAGAGAMIGPLGMAGVATGSVGTAAGGIAAGTAGVLGAVASLNGDDSAPAVTAAQSFSYEEKASAGATVGTVAATDNVGVTGYRFTATGTSTSADGFYAIGSNGLVTLTAAGAAAGAASNDFETAPNSFTHGLQARDAAGNWSASTNVTFQVTDVDDSAPAVTAAQSFSYEENASAGATVGTVAATDNVGVTGYRFTATGTSTSADGFYAIGSNGLVTLTAAGAAAGAASNDFETAPNSFTYGLQARDAAGNWSASTNVTFQVTDLPEVLSDQAFGYTENRQAGSFIGSVDVSALNGVVDYRFWNPMTETLSSISPDGFFSIDTRGHIRLTELGARSYANDADDTQPGGPLNSHRYFIQAKNPADAWSRPVAITLNEKNCVCDDAALDYLINYMGSGVQSRTLKNGEILSTTVDENYAETITIEGPVNSGKEIIRMISSGGIDPSNNILFLDLSLKDSTNNTAPAAFLDDVACINLQASRQVELLINSLLKNDGTGTGNALLSDGFMPSLEKIYLSNRVGDDFVPNGRAALKFTNYGSKDWMPLLKDITMFAGRDSISLQFENRAEEFPWSPTDTPRPRDVDRGDSFMASLETIYLEGEARVYVRVANQSGDDFMRSLTSITAIGGSSQNGMVLVEFDSIDSKGMAILGDDGYAQGFMSALEVVTAVNKSQNEEAKIDFINSGSADDYMTRLSLVNIESINRETLYFKNQGGKNYMGSLEEISMTHSKSTFGAILAIENISQYDEQSNVFSEGSNFMTSLQSIKIVSEGQVGFSMVNTGGSYYLNDDYSTPYSYAYGENFMPSLKNIFIQAGALETVTFDMQVKVDATADPTTLSSMESLTILGGEINAKFDVSLELQEWFDFGKIQGNSDSAEDSFQARDDWANKLVVIGGFDAGDLDDEILFESVMQIDELADLRITTEGQNVRIRYHEDFGYSGSIVILNVADKFVVADNIFIA